MLMILSRLHYIGRSGTENHMNEMKINTSRPVTMSSTSVLNLGYNDRKLKQKYNDNKDVFTQVFIHISGADARKGWGGGEKSPNPYPPIL